MKNSKRPEEAANKTASSLEIDSMPKESSEPAVSENEHITPPAMPPHIETDPGNIPGSGTVLLTGYTAVGWISDSYIVVTKGNSLYVSSPAGGTPLKVSDFQDDGIYSKL